MMEEIQNENSPETDTTVVDVETFDAPVAYSSARPQDQAISHSDMVRTLAKTGDDIKAKITQGSFNLLMETVQRAVEAGQIVDDVKKQIVYQKDMGYTPVGYHAVQDLSPEMYHLLHMAIGMFGEAAELLESLYESIINGNPIDVDNLVEELGDGEFYNEGFRQGLGIHREDILQGNITKLAARYEGFVYTDAAAQARADKA